MRPPEPETLAQVVATTDPELAIAILRARGYTRGAALRFLQIGEGRGVPGKKQHRDTNKCALLSRRLWAWVCSRQPYSARWDRQPPPPM